ncbi:aspartic peptidase domain-containing protein [Fennellomyces sp. T-0311]|nr:aspartic peptidase domain-containing protein [Fennellomyces sp. T-0311]
MHITASVVLLSTAVASFAYASDPVIRMPLIRKGRSFSTINARRRSLDKRDPFQTSLYNDGGSQYLVEVGVGSPAQNFTVTLDTGSADLWVPSTDCPTSECPYTRFDPAQSSTYNSTNEKFGIIYGIGTVNGTYVTDTVTVAGVSVQNQQFGLASTTADILTNPTTLGGSGTDTPSNNASHSSDSPIGNGILGLGYPKLTAANSAGEPEYNPFVFNLVQQKLISQPIFSVYMNSAAEEGWVGEVIFGGVDDTKYTGDLTYLPVAQLATSHNPLDSLLGSSSDAYYYWMVYGQGIGLENSQTSGSNGVSFDSTVPFIIDTGTTLTYFPDDVANQVAAGLVGVGNYQLDRQSQVLMCDCSAGNSGASLQLQMSSSKDVSSNPVTLTVPASELVIPLDAISLQDATYCMLGIAPVGSSNTNMFLVGDSVLRSAYLVFDMGENRIGFAAAQNVAGSVNGVGSSSSSVVLPGATPILLTLTITAIILLLSPM